MVIFNRGRKAERRFRQKVYNKFRNASTYRTYWGFENKRRRSELFLYFKCLRCDRSIHNKTNINLFLKDGIDICIGCRRKFLDRT